MNELFYNLCGLIYAIILDVFRAILLKTTWGWFIVPLFHVPELTIAYACGLMLVWVFLTQKITSKSIRDVTETDLEDRAAVLVAETLFLAISFIAAYIVKQFI